MALSSLPLPSLPPLATGSVLIRNVVYNLLGQGAPLAMALFTIPALLQGLGGYRFGLLTFAWMLLSCFMFFDLGVGRTLTLVTAAKLADGREDELPPLFWTACLFILLLGAAGTLLLLALLPWATTTVFPIPPEVRAETMEAFAVLAFSFPIVITSLAFQGMLEAHQRYDLINLARLLAGFFTYIAPWAVLFFSARLSLVFAALVGGRLVLLVFSFLCVWRVMPSLRRRWGIEVALIRILVGFGGWITLSNMLSMATAYVDRFLIGAVGSVVALAYYATPYDLVTRQLLIPSAVASVMFPAFSAAYLRDRRHAGDLFCKSAKYTLLLLFPLALIIITLAPEGLDLWLGREFAAQSTRVLQYLSIGVLLNGLAMIPHALVQGAGRPDLTAKLYFLEFPLYLPLLWLLLKHWGIDGVALAWTLRVALDGALLLYLTQGLLRLEGRLVARMLLTLSAALAVLLAALGFAASALKGVFLCTILAGFVLCTWQRFLSAPERQWVAERLRRMASFAWARSLP